LSIFSKSPDFREYFARKYQSEELFFIAGGDSITSMDRWREPERIFAKCGIIAAVRSESDKERAIIKLKDYHARIFWINNPIIDISSTQIRSMLQEGKNISAYVPREIQEYIMENNLYR
jgi:nicotinate-nucleotide adenylyltransferase